MASLKNKVVLITGASSGIGRGAAVHIASLGAKLSITGRNEENLQKTVDELKSQGHPADKIITIVADLSVDDDVKKVIDHTVEHYGKLDVLVSNAGIVREGSIETMTMKDYDEVMGINCRSMIYLTHLAVPHLIKTKGTAVIVSSVNGMRSFPNLIAYCVSKGAIDHFVRCASLDLAPKQVRINAVNPGVIKTEIHRRGGNTEEQYQAFIQRSCTTHPLGRVGEVDEVAKAIAFFASDDSSFITGSVMPIDGGRHCTCLR